MCSLFRNTLSCRPYACVAVSEPWNHLVFIKPICILRLKLNGPSEVVVKPSFSTSDLSFPIMAQENDQSVTITEMALTGNGWRSADSNDTSYCFKQSQGDLNLYHPSSRPVFLFLHLAVNMQPSNPECSTAKILETAQDRLLFYIPNKSLYVVF